MYDERKEQVKDNKDDKVERRWVPSYLYLYNKLFVWPFPSHPPSMGHAELDNIISIVDY